MVSVLLLPTNVHVDNYGYDIRNAGTTDVESLKTNCGNILYCCGFPSAFGLS